MPNSSRQLVWALLASLAVFFGTWFLLDWAVWVSVILAVGTYAGVFMVTKPQLRIGNIVVDSLPDGDALKKLLLEAKDDLDAIQKATNQITNVEIRNQGETLYATGIKILEYLEKHPERINTARRFFGYYLNTARDILEKYLPFQNSGLHTEDVRRVTQSTIKAMPILNEAFEKQFNHLMQNDIMDIEADIKVLEMTLNQEGD